jgi:hypothetical protein
MFHPCFNHTRRIAINAILDVVALVQARNDCPPKEVLLLLLLL